MKTTKKELLDQIKRLESQLQDYRNERKDLFNKYTFIEDLQTSIKEEIENGNLNDEDDIRTHINEAIENACIYYRTCFEIVQELGITSWEDYAKEIGEIHSISQVAFMALRELTDEELSINDFTTLIEERDDKQVNI